MESIKKCFTIIINIAYQVRVGIDIAKYLVISKVYYLLLWNKTERELFFMEIQWKPIELVFIKYITIQFCDNVVSLNKVL